jgi:hypothetical protein
MDNLLINEINHEEQKKKRKYIRNKSHNKPKSKKLNKDHEINVLKGPIWIFGGLF